MTSSNACNATMGAVGAALALALACGGGSDAPPDVSAQDVREEAREALEAAAAYAAAQRDELVERARETVDEAQRETNEARRELADLPQAARDRLAGAIDRVERAGEALGDELEALERTGEQSWETTQQRVSDALDELAEARREVMAALADERSDQAGDS